MGSRRSSRILLSLIAAAGCTGSKNTIVNEPVIIVNSEKLTAQDFSQRLGKKLKAFDALAAKDPTNLKRSKELVIKDFIVSALLRQYASSKNLSVSDEEVNIELDHLRKSYPDDLSFKSALAGDGSNTSEWKESLRKTLLEKKAFSTIGPGLNDPSLQNEAHKYYENHHSEFQRQAEIHVKQIVLNKKDDAERLWNAIKKGSSFEEMAKKYSVSPDGPKGGDVGFISKGILPIFDSVFNYKIGQMSSVLKSSYGFHIVKVIDKRPAMLKSFEQARQRIVEKLASEKQQVEFSHWLETAVKNAKVEKNEWLINKINVRTEGQQE